jgi:hypothetical protein
VISGFNNIINIGGFTCFGINRIRFINVPGLFFRELAAFNPVGIITKFYQCNLPPFMAQSVDIMNAPASHAHPCSLCGAAS